MSLILSVNGGQTEILALQKTNTWEVFSFNSFLCLHFTFFVERILPFKSKTLIFNLNFKIEITQA